MPVRNLLIIVVATVFSMACYDRAQRNRYAAGVADAMRAVSAEYIREVEIDDLYHRAMDGLVGSLDPYSSYISADEYQQVKVTWDQEFGGIGIELMVDPDQQRPMVASPMAGTPAFRAGMRAGDVILKIDERDTKGMTLNEVVSLLRGVVGTTVEVTIQHAGQDRPLTLLVQRAIIPVESIKGDIRKPDGSWDFRLEQDPRITYVRLTNFGEATSRELREVFNIDAAVRPTEAVILDLRGNDGGLLTAAIDTCNAFIDHGLIVTTRGRGGVVEESFEATSKVLIPATVPLVVLIDHDSASASEIVAACLQDHERAVIVGVRSWGKGTVQKIIELEGGRSAIRLTTASYWRPSGVNIHREGDSTDDQPWGVKPNPGFDVLLSEEEMKMVAQYRRQRDVYYGDQRPPTDQPVPGSNPGQGQDTVPATAESDRQLQKAIQYLQERLQGDDTAPRAAYSAARD
jgi:carboxyl-terminal processing protease